MAGHHKVEEEEVEKEIMGVIEEGEVMVKKDRLMKLEDQRIEDEVEVKQAMKLLGDEWADMYQRMLPEPLHFITLTYRELKVHPDKAYKDLKYYVSQINHEILGAKYKNRVKHSYFSYIAVMELQTRGTPHWHIIADNWLPYRYMHQIWNTFLPMRGYQWVERIHSPKNYKSGGTVTGAYNYLAKYMTKESATDVIWVRDNHFDLLPHQKRDVGKLPIRDCGQKESEGVKPEVQAVQSRLDEAPKG